jgi:Peptidase family S41
MRQSIAPTPARPLARMRNMRLQSKRFVRGFGDTAPVFDLPPDFQVRLGQDPLDFFYSGTFRSEGLRIGYLRIPSFDGGDFESADFQKEIAYLQENTDGLILDVMRNPGGDACFAEDLLSRLNPRPFRTVGLEIRATRSWVADFLLALEDAVASGADSSVIAQLQNNLMAIQQAFHQPSGRTAPLPVCGPSLDLNPGKSPYTNPILLLTDEFTASAADLFAAVLQDNQRALLFGNRTMGAGGNVTQYHATTYSDGSTLVTESLMSRPQQIVANGFPTSRYIENVGVHPNVLQDYMTADNLKNHGRTFVQAFTATMTTYIPLAKIVWAGGGLTL